mgnify:CR=1 FL=1|jgi:hypothetical protein
MSQSPFVCSECGSRVSAASFRAACPDCGGSLTQPSLDEVRTDDALDGPHPEQLERHRER